MSQPDIYKASHPIRVVTATSLFDGHDASINIMRRMLQDSGVEVIHLGHNRSVAEIVNAAIEEDVQGIAVSSYQGGHTEFFQYMIDLLKEHGAEAIRVFGGGGGVIVPEEIQLLERYGVCKIYSPEDGARMGLQGIINDMIQRMDFSSTTDFKLDAIDWSQFNANNHSLIAKLISYVEQHKTDDDPDGQAIRQLLKKHAHQLLPPVIGVTGTGGAGKSSLVDELILRFLRDEPDVNIAIVCCDPSRRKTGGSLLGDRIRMNAIMNDRIYMRSLATRASRTELSDAINDSLFILKAAGFDLIIAETAGIGQGDAGIVDWVDFSIYVMTSEFGSASQLEKIDMLDYADMVVVNKFEKQGSEDALRDVRKQVQRNRKQFDQSPESMPVFGAIASKFNDDGVTSVYAHIKKQLQSKFQTITWASLHLDDSIKTSSAKSIIIPPERTRYLSEISDTIRTYHLKTQEQADFLRACQHLQVSAELIHHSQNPDITHQDVVKQLKKEQEHYTRLLSPETMNLITEWPKIQDAYSGDHFVYKVRDREFKVPLYTESLSHQNIPKVVLPKFKDDGEIFRWLREESLPGQFPYTAGVFPFKRTDEDPTRMFAGEGGPHRTNKRFKLLSADSSGKRLSTAFDSATLYGYDPDIRPDIYGKIGTSGVSICTLDDMKILYSGFDLCAPSTSVSMTINGPAPIILAMFFNTAIDQQVDAYEHQHGKAPNQETYKTIKKDVLSNIRGTVQADILKEDQGQNTCIFSIEFALRMMGDIQAYFTENLVKNFYSVSISGYHIAEAGANPISQLAFTLANGFTYVEYYLSRGMNIDTFGPNLSFFFSNGMDPEYNVIGRVARRIWAITMREKYGASERAQKLKYHIQTSGRSLHSQDIQFNDIRTTLQALCAVYDNCNSLHTNAFDEAVTTPSEESVRRALAIQLIINREWGLARNENVQQGSFIIEELTRLVEEAVLFEFDQITRRGGVLGAMETGYQRSKIQEESIYYETRKHTGDLPIIGVNTFRDPNTSDENMICELELARATEDEKQSQLKRLEAFQQKHADKAPEALQKLQKVAISGDNIFDELLNTVQYCSLGQITKALYDIGGQYRRNM
ncbi:MAG: methylmalonyl-CoA mutase family protein [Candidatus Magnetomorum sp.]|nr:methylmalonyl-CoA mutase family protein [Candidatus Magnetomorum sp.]